MGADGEEELAGRVAELDLGRAEVGHQPQAQARTLFRPDPVLPVATRRNVRPFRCQTPRKTRPALCANGGRAVPHGRQQLAADEAATGLVDADHMHQRPQARDDVLHQLRSAVAWRRFIQTAVSCAEPDEKPLHGPSDPSHPPTILLLPLPSPPSVSPSSPSTLPTLLSLRHFVHRLTGWWCARLGAR